MVSPISSNSNAESAESKVITTKHDCHASPAVEPTRPERCSTAQFQDLPEMHSSTRRNSTAFKLPTLQSFGDQDAKPINHHEIGQNELLSAANRTRMERGEIVGLSLASYKEGADLHGVIFRAPQDLGRGDQLAHFFPKKETGESRRTLVTMTSPGQAGVTATGGWGIVATVQKSGTSGDDFHLSWCDFAFRPSLTVKMEAFPGTSVRFPALRFDVYDVDPTDDSAEALPPEYSTLREQEDQNVCSVEHIKPGTYMGSVYRMKTGIETTDIYQHAENPVFGAFSAFVAISPEDAKDVENADKIKEAFGISHGVSNPVNSQIPIDSIPEEMPIGYYSKPGEILTSKPAHAISMLQPWVSVKRGADGLTYVLRSRPAKEDATRNNYKKLFSQPCKIQFDQRRDI